MPCTSLQYHLSIFQISSVNVTIFWIYGQDKIWMKNITFFFKSDLDNELSPKFDIEIVHLAEVQQFWCLTSLINGIFLCSKFQVLTFEGCEVATWTKFWWWWRRTISRGDIIIATKLNISMYFERRSSAESLRKVEPILATKEQCIIG